MTLEPVSLPPLLTDDLPGIGGTIKTFPEDFEVEEIPAYEPSGNGDFLYLWIEKRDLGAEFFTRQIARRLAISVGDVGTAGLKDRRSVSRQWVSVPAGIEPRLDQLEGDGLHVLAVSRHNNKLKPGHLRGNRFRILIRDTVAEPEPYLDRILHRLREEGLPNFYGPQRFGRDGETLALGLAMLRKTPLPARAPRNPFLRKLALSAAQSALFNSYLGQRMADGLLRRVLPGDVMARWPVGGLFVVEDLPREQSRFDDREIVMAGPMFGRKTFPAREEAAHREEQILTQAQLTRSSFEGFGKLVQGTRRHNLVYLDGLSGVLEPEGVRLSFALPAGSYATVLLREVMKSEGLLGEEE